MHQRLTLNCAVKWKVNLYYYAPYIFTRNKTSKNKDGQSENHLESLHHCYYSISSLYARVSPRS